MKALTKLTEKVVGYINSYPLEKLQSIEHPLLWEWPIQAEWLEVCVCQVRLPIPEAITLVEKLLFWVNFNMPKGTIVKENHWWWDRPKWHDCNGSIWWFVNGEDGVRTEIHVGPENIEKQTLCVTFAQYPHTCTSVVGQLIPENL